MRKADKFVTKFLNAQKENWDIDKIDKAEYEEKPMSKKRFKSVKEMTDYLQGKIDREDEILKIIDRRFKMYRRKLNASNGEEAQRYAALMNSMDCLKRELKEE